MLYRLRVIEVRATFVKTVDTLGLGPIDFAPHVRKHIRVSVQVETIPGRIAFRRNEFFISREYAVDTECL